MGVKRYVWSWKTTLLLVGVLILFSNAFYQSDLQIKVAWVALVICLWWIFEVLPLGVTALVPVFAFPLLGIMPAKEVTPVYMSPILMVFIGGFLMSIAIQKWQLHRRIALSIVVLFSGTPSRLVLGFMLATAFLSMWISNTASAIMMVSIGLTVIRHYEDEVGIDENSRIFASALMMSIAYAASIGGIATPVGTPPNLAFIRIYEMNFPGSEALSFGQWISFALPTAIVMLLMSWVVLTRIFLKSAKVKELDHSVIRREFRALGKMSAEEKKVGVVFAILVLLWIFRKNLPFPHIDDGTVAILCALSLFALPAKDGQKLLDSRAIREIPWHTVLLFGGGFALAKGIQESGLARSIGQGLDFLGDYPTGYVVTALSFIMSFLTELTSNTASTELFLPILAAMAKEFGANPLSFMIPITLAASCAFMLPVATPPNAIIFGSQRVKILEMAAYGFIINVLCIVVISLVGTFLLPLFFSP